MSGGHRVLLLTRDGCHLCEDAAAIVSRACEETGVSWESIDVDSEADLRMEWTDHVPVTFVDGELHGRWFVDPEKLREALLYGEPRPMSPTWRPAAVPN